MNKRELTTLCREFRKGMLDGKPSKGQCAKVSWALQGFLSFMKVKTEVYESHVGQWNHLYLVMENGNVIDCTADQFNRKYPKAYIGKPLDIHKNGKPYKITR